MASTTTTTTTFPYENPQDVALASHSVMALSLEETDYNNDNSKSVDRTAAAHVDDAMMHPEEDQQHRLNRLELEHAYLAEQNTHLTKELSFARCTISALRNITTQKEENLQATRQELDRAYFRIKMLGMTLMRQEQQMQQQQQAWMEMIQQQQQQQQSYDDDDDESGHLSHRSLTTAAAHRHIEALLQRRAGKEQQQRHLDHQQQLTPPESPRRVDEQGQGLDEY